MKFGKSRIFLLLCLSFIVGIFLGNYLNYYIIALAAMIFIMLITLFWRRRMIMTFGFCGLIMLAGAVRLILSFPDDDPNFIGKFYGQKVELEGVVVREPDIRSDKTNLTIGKIVIPAQAGIQGMDLRVKPEDGRLSGNILLNIGKYPEYQYGDKLKISGKLEEPFESPEFSYKDYLSRYETYGVVRYPVIEKIREDAGNPVKSTLLSVKKKFQDVFSGLLPEPHNALLLGIILGIKKALPEGFKEALAVVGVSHIVVISGFNISIFTKKLLETRRWIGKSAAFWLSAILLTGFVIMTGAEASVIRAAIMGFMLLLALQLGRLYQAERAIIFAAAVMIFQNPKILEFDVGFQLSFLATLGLMYLSPVFEEWFAKLPNILQLRENLSATSAAIIFTLPLLSYYFGRISLVAVLANVLVLWVVPYTMGLGMLFGILGLINLSLAKLFYWLMWAILEYIIWIVEFFANIPLAQVSAKISIPLVVIYYGLLILWLLWYRRKKDFHYYLEYMKSSI